jgi:dienelactone hydrolase
MPMTDTFELDPSSSADPSTRIEQPLQGPGGLRLSRNVNRATLTAFPVEGATTAVIVCPGGGWHILAFDHEGIDVAQALNKHGVSAYVLEYRVLPTPVDDAAFQQHMAELMSDPTRLPSLVEEFTPTLLADGAAALDYVRGDASYERVGMVGFSAGGYLVTALTLAANAPTPDFVASVYGAHFDRATEVADDAPPLFLALADDDPLVDVVRAGALELHRAWHAARRPVELHVFEDGGHGFGMQTAGTASARWFDAFAAWIDRRS